MWATVLSLLSTAYAPFRWVACKLCGKEDAREIDVRQEASHGFRGFSFFSTQHITNFNFEGSRLEQSTSIKEPEEGVKDDA